MDRSFNKPTVNTNGEEISMVLLILLMDNPNSFLPELVQIFGEKNTLKFLDIFSGITIKVPKMSKMYTIMRNVEIFYKIYNKKATYADLAKEYGLQKQTVMDIYSRIKLYHDGLNLKKIVS